MSVARTAQDLGSGGAEPALEVMDVRLEVEPRGDGGVRIRSPDERGLILGGPDPARTLNNVTVALPSLLRANQGKIVEAMEMRGDHVRVTFRRAV